MSEQNPKEMTYRERFRDYINGCLDPENQRVYGTFQERAAFNITQFPKIQGSLLIRMGLVYPIVSKFVEYAGIPTDSASDFCGVAINYHTWAAGYLAYLAEVQLGMSKYPIEFISSGMDSVRRRARNLFPTGD